MGGDLERLLTVPEVARLLGLAPSRVYDLAREKVLPAVRLGRQIRFSLDALRAFIDGGGQALPGPGGWRRAAGEGCEAKAGLENA
jgi:excisionase family DNA binding protein